MEYGDFRGVHSLAHLGHGALSERGMVKCFCFRQPRYPGHPGRLFALISMPIIS